jgi:hypothetical protein
VFTSIGEGMQRASNALARDDQFIVLVSIACLGLKAVLLILDSQVRFFMGDSATYLVSAIHASVPSDRSFTYPLLIHCTAGLTGSLSTLLILQALLGTGTATFVCAILRDVFHVRRKLAAMAALAVAAEPSQLFYERMVMTESASTFVLIASIAMAFAYVRHGELTQLLACIFLGLALASLRVGLVPIAVSLGIASVALRFCAEPSKRRWSAHLLTAVIATLALHGAYKTFCGIRMHSEPVYIRDGGLFELGLVAPLVKPVHFEDTGVDAALLSDVRISLSDARAREAQIWAPDGLIAVLKQHAGANAYAVARVVAARAMRDDPIGLVRLGLETTRDYFDGDQRRARLASDLGSDRPLDAKLISLLHERFHDDDVDSYRVVSLAYSYFAASSTWLIVCLFTLAPLSLAVLVLCWKHHRRVGILVALLGTGFTIGQILCSQIISFRYLHPFPVLVITCGAIVLEAVMSAMPARNRNRIPQNKRLAEASL